MRRSRKGNAGGPSAPTPSIAIEAVAPLLALAASAYLLVTGLRTLLGGNAFGSVLVTFGVLGIVLACKLSRAPLTPIAASAPLSLKARQTRQHLLFKQTGAGRCDTAEQEQSDGTV